MLAKKMNMIPAKISGRINVLLRIIDFSPDILLKAASSTKRATIK